MISHPYLNPYLALTFVRFRSEPSPTNGNGEFEANAFLATWLRYDFEVLDREWPEFHEFVVDTIKDWKDGNQPPDFLRPVPASFFTKEPAIDMAIRSYAIQMRRPDEDRSHEYNARSELAYLIEQAVAKPRKRNPRIDDVDDNDDWPSAQPLDKFPTPHHEAGPIMPRPPGDNIYFAKGSKVLTGNVRPGKVKKKVWDEVQGKWVTPEGGKTPPDQ